MAVGKRRRWSAMSRPVVQGQQVIAIVNHGKSGQRYGYFATAGGTAVA
jgi:hypothetical protein